MLQAETEFRIRTRSRGLYEITDQIEKWISDQHWHTGLLTLHIRHTSASLLVQENADPDVRRDLDAFFARLVPDGDSLYIHTCEGKDDMPAHVRAVLTASNLSIPVSNSRLALGTWQGIYVWEHRLNAHSRAVAAHFIGE
jgi:secondary thiamine-phosphate synthase enzyme